MIKEEEGDERWGDETREDMRAKYLKRVWVVLPEHVSYIVYKHLQILK